MEFKRLTLLCGHYGSGKTNIAVNMAYDLKKQHEKTIIADLDIVNPYFRTKDSSGEFEDLGIRLICSDYANSNVDIPALPQDIYVLTEDKGVKAIIDVGGDDRGALALGRLTPAILAENDYSMYMVLNFYRPLTRDAESVLEVMAEIETACGIKFTGLINNSNLGVETTADDVVSTNQKALEVAKLTALPLVLTTVDENIYGEVKDKLQNVLPLKLQSKII